MAASSLEAFSRRVRDLLSSSDRQRQPSRTEADQFMREWQAKRQEFEEVVARISRDIILPRLELLQRHLPQARLARRAGGAQSTCWLAYSPRFPASMKVELTIEPDASLEHAVVRSEVYLVPAFVRYDAHDKFVARLDGDDDPQLVRWVEDRLIQALETYLQLDRGSDDAGDEPVVDPVCGMRLRRSSAPAQADHRGHAYFFCSELCRRKFAAAPEQFVQVVLE